MPRCRCNHSVTRQLGPHLAPPNETSLKRLAPSPCGAASRGNSPRRGELSGLNWIGEGSQISKEYTPMKALLAGAALAAACISPALADFYIVQNPTTKRCTVVEQRPANPSIGVVVGGDTGFGVRTEAESRMKS